MAVKFMGENSVQFSSEQGSPKVDVLVDGCKVRKKRYGFYYLNMFIIYILLNNTF